MAVVDETRALQSSHFEQDPARGPTPHASALSATRAARLGEVQVMQIQAPFQLCSSRMSMKLESPQQPNRPKQPLEAHMNQYTRFFDAKTRSLPHVSNQEGKLHDMTVLSNQLIRRVAFENFIVLGIDIINKPELCGAGCHQQ